MSNSPLNRFGRADPNDPVRQIQNGLPQAGQTIFQSTPIAEEPKSAVKRSRLARNRLVVFSHFIISILMIGAVATGAAAYYGKTQFDKPGSIETAKVFVVEKNSNLRDISVRLFTEGLISDERIFQMAVRAMGN
ncbi:MAG: hypothetical protein ACRCT6_11415, partial [Notoacmeibacter sp.]